MEIKKKQAQTIARADFLKQVGTGFGAIVLMNCIQSCADDSIPDPVAPTPTGKLDFTVNINDTANAALKSKGGFLVNKANNVIIARTNDDTWIAVDSRCTHQQVEVKYEATANNFVCPLHGSTFSSTGAVVKSPATSPLTKYNTTFSANTGVLRVFA
jgi:cytochrome b6-f complex iron-sulfur subunit